MLKHIMLLYVHQRKNEAGSQRSEQAVDRLSTVAECQPRLLLKKEAFLGRRPATRPLETFQAVFVIPRSHSLPSI